MSDQLKLCKWLMDSYKIELKSDYLNLVNLCRDYDKSKKELYGLLFRYRIDNKKKKLLKEYVSVSKECDCDELIFELVKNFTSMYIHMTQDEKYGYKFYVNVRNGMNRYLCKEIVDIVYSYVHIF